MRPKLNLLFLLLFLPFFSQSQDLKKLTALTLSDELTAGANAVVRQDDILIEISSYNKFVETNSRIITVLNKKGNDDIGAVFFYDKNTNIKNLEVRIYDNFGQEINKFKKKDFEDQSAVSNGTLYADNRVKYLRYTPINYPYTVKIESVVEHTSSAFLPGWRPIEGFYVSTENAEYRVENNSGVELKTKATNCEPYGIEKVSDFHYTASNIPALKPEAYAPDFYSYAPRVKIALTEFDMEGVKGVNPNWETFGQWYNDKLLFDTQELPESVKTEIKSLTANASTDLEKAKMVYQYVQNKTRYISVQVGIGGWKPMYAKDVDRLGYGDCKGLTNYTKALLDVVGVTSYHTLIYGSSDLQDLDSEFSAVQGNHMILTIPHEGDYVWLECTSQTAPFGYNANFTDDRDALVVTPEGGKIVRTKKYLDQDNLQKIKAQVNLLKEGVIQAQVSIKTYGTQYGYHHFLDEATERDQEKYYKKKFWSHLNGLRIEKTQFENDKDSIVFSESVDLSLNNYGMQAGKDILINPNLFNRYTNVPPKYKERKLPFEIERGFVDEDETEIQMTSNIIIEGLFQDVNLKSKFGEYAISIKPNDQGNLIYNRTLKLFKGSYTKEEYQEFREFLIEVSKYDNSKIILKNRT